MNKGFTRKRSRYHSHKIDKFLLQEYEHRKKEIQLLLVGLPNSGKNTFCKQLRLHFGDGFPTSYRIEMKPTILANTTDAIALVLEYMKDSGLIFSDILAHRLQEYLVNSRSENGWITKDFILFEPECNTNNNNNYSVLKRQQSPTKAKRSEPMGPRSGSNYQSHSSSLVNHCSMIMTNTISPELAAKKSFISPEPTQPGLNDALKVANNSNSESCGSSFQLPLNPVNNTNANCKNTESITDSIVERFLHYVDEHNSIPPSVLKKFESIIDVKSLDNWQSIIQDKATLHHLIHILLQSGIDNWSSFLMQGSTPPPAPTTLPPVSVEDELLDYIVTSESLDTSEEGDEDYDEEEKDGVDEGKVKDRESEWTTSSNSLERTLVKSNSSTGEICDMANFSDENGDENNEDSEQDDWDNCINHLADLRTGDGLNTKTNSRLLNNNKLKNKGRDHVKSTSGTSHMKANYVELNSNFNLLEFSIDQLPASANCSEHKISLRSLQIIMKIITDQVEFRKAFIDFLPILSHKSYAGSYFIKCVDRIIQDDYVPTLQDLLIMKQSSKAVRESLISIGSINLRTINLGEQSEHLNKRFHYFESVNMIIFFISLEDVYRFTTIEENKMTDHQTFKLFGDIVNSPDLARKEIIVFLNKVDVIKSVVSQTNNNNNNSNSNNSKNIDNDAMPIDKDGENRADSTNWTVLIEEIKSCLTELRNNAKIRVSSHLYFHVTCALDIDEMKWITKDCLRTIFELNRRRHLIF
ncbi:unnamed protein product [Trichobilharzia szidati]|nr:unnamed protein product [Trichobilharzia szidati]CAH8857501.1 unnamed protein product [Trichobilharzia szidati]